jgi:hypothetical protein
MGVNAMICPNCKKKLTEIIVFSECWQQATVEGNNIERYGSIGGDLEPTDAQCPKCYVSVFDLIDEF